MKRLRRYFDEVWSELRKVSWPTREQVLSLFRVVLLVTVAAAIILGAISLVFNELFAIGLQNPIIFVLVGVVVAALTFYIMRREGQHRT